MPDQCPNHGKYSDEEKLVAKRRVGDALTLLWEGRVARSEGVREELQHAELFGAIEGLPMDFAGITFREPSRMHGRHLCYMSDWILKREASVIAQRINEDIVQGISAA